MYTVNKEYQSNMSSVFVLSIDTIHERACNRDLETAEGISSLHLNMQLHGRIQMDRERNLSNKPVTFCVFKGSALKLPGLSCA